MADWALLQLSESKQKCYSERFSKAANAHSLGRYVQF